jgi:PAS domain S-box-containing protein
MSSDGGTTTEHVETPLERLSDGVLALDDEWSVTHINETAGEILALDRETVVGESVGTHLDDETASAFEIELQAAMEAGQERQFALDSDTLSRRLTGTIYPSSDGVTVLLETSGEHAVSQAERTSALERLHEVAADRDCTREEKIERLLEIGREQFGTSNAFMTHIEDGTQTIVQSVGDYPELASGNTAPLSEAYCRHTLGSEEPLAVTDATAEGWESDPAYERFGLGCYLGATLYVDDEQYGTVCFADTDPRESTFDEYELSFAELLTDWIHYLLEQQSYEQELEQQQAFTESLINSLPDPLYAFDRDGTLLRWNDRLEEVTGYTPEELASMQHEEFVTEADSTRVLDAMADVLEGEQLSIETTMTTSDDSEIPYEFSGAPLRDESGEIIGTAGVGRDITEQIAHQERLSGILETTRSLMQARDRVHVGELAVSAVADLLDVEASVFRLYDGDAGTLEPIAQTDAVGELMGERPVYEVGDGYPGEVFASGEPRVIDTFDPSERPSELGEIQSAMYYPVGVHGTITVGSTEPEAFDETDRQVLALLATSAAGACMRAKRMREVREAREHTERVLERVNGLIENTVEVLVQATTREEIESGVVRELAATEPYTFAWIGQPDVTTETLSPTAWDGEVSLPVQGRTFDLQHGGEPVSDAYLERTTQVLTDPENMYGPWADIVAGHDVEGTIVIPLVYKDATYGVLAVCAEDSEVFDERERIVLEALGRAVSNAINAVERGRILDATEIIELEFAISDRELLFSRLSSGADCRLESASIEHHADGDIRLYLTAHGGDPERVLELAREMPQVTDVTCIVEQDEECLLELVLEESLLGMVTEYGAVPQQVVAEDGTTRFTVELPYEAEARELFELVEDRHPGTELLGYHERERAVETRNDFKAALSERLTDRQETALRTSYLGGFFDWPRDIDGNELAASMDISRPTFHQHLRTAQAKVFEELFE